MAIVAKVLTFVICFGENNGIQKYLNPYEYCIMGNIQWTALNPSILIVSLPGM